MGTAALVPGTWERIAKMVHCFVLPDDGYVLGQRADA